ncbi:MAG: hypothetical protein ACTTJL_06880, partial [Hoylesella enoeca]|uniref:hypothetical protein n=1 Tax=Hoylesella enoeca TaxID=76123 RepID=UPI003FA17472
GNLPRQKNNISARAEEQKIEKTAFPPRRKRIFINHPKHSDCQSLDIVSRAGGQQQSPCRATDGGISQRVFPLMRRFEEEIGTTALAALRGQSRLK